MEAGPLDEIAARLQSAIVRKRLHVILEPLGPGASPPPKFATQLACGASVTALGAAAAPQAPELGGGATSFALSFLLWPPVIAGAVVAGLVLWVLPWDASELTGLFLGGYLGVVITAALVPWGEWGGLGTPENMLGMSVTPDQAVILALAVLGGVVAAALFVANLDVRSFVNGFPQLFPAALIVLLVPLFTAELWRLAGSMGWWQFPLFVLLLIGPVWFLAYRRLRETTTVAFDEVGSELSEALQVGDVPAEELAKAVKQADVDDDLRSLARNAYVCPSEELTRLTKLLTPRFRQMVGVKLVPLTVAVLAFSAAFFFLLAVVLVDGSVAAEWATPSGSSEVAGVPRAGWEYVAVALVLGTAAAASFLALLTTDPERTRAVTRALVHDPIRACLIIALPYGWLREQTSQSNRPQDADTAPAPPRTDVAV